MAGDEDRRGERSRSERRDPARAIRREPPTIDGSAEDVTQDQEVGATEAAPEPMSKPSVESQAAAYEIPTAGSSSDTFVHPDPEIAETAATPQEAAGAEALVSGNAESARDRVERGRSNFAAAMAVAIVIMAGAIVYLFYQMSFLGPDTSGEVAGLTARVAALENRPAPDTSGLARQAGSAQEAAAAAQAGLAALTKRVDGLAAPQPAPPNLQPQVADLQGSLADMKKSLAGLQATVAAIPRPDVNRIEARFGDLDGRIASLQGAVSGIPRVDLGPLTGKVDALEARLKPLETEVQAAQSPQRVAERRAAPVAVTAQAISDAIAAGQPFPQEFRALQVLGADAGKLAPLQLVAANGAPSLHELQDALAQVRDRITHDGTPAPSGSYMDRLMAGAGSLVQVRPLGSVVGDAPAAVVARMNDEIGADDLAAALADWQKLPEASRSVSKSLPDRIKLRLDAETAAREIAANAIGALAAPRG